mmetsp:Transcript_24684/g.36191  ORF Transcript_24684/g.36191 Transcript_24684/m.36191 type:complete len:104 (-) Transcript_24684:153-464(-)
MNESTLDMQAIQENTQFLGKVRLISAVFSGLAAGIFGFTNLIGFAWYYFIYLFTSTLLLVKLKFDLKAYLLTSPLSFFVFGMFKHLMAFVLFWALAYTVTEIY